MRGHSQKKTPILHDYKLQSTKNVKYLGVNISDDLSWTKHINQLTTKGNITLNLLKETSKHIIGKLKNLPLKHYVRPLLEYSASIWDPWQNKYINQIEMVQHRAVRYIFNQHTSSITSMLNNFHFQQMKKEKNLIIDHVPQNIP